MTTVSDVLAAGPRVSDRVSSPEAASVSAAGVRTRGRARESLAVTERYGKIVAPFALWGRQAGTDLRDAWWTPASLPTFQRAWAERMPDRDRVPGGNGLLYAGWVVYNHTFGLAVPAAVIALVGALTPLVWLARHPARLLLAAVIATALYALVFGTPTLT